MKQYILVRQDLKMPKGKLANQVAHASIGAARKVSIDKVDEWFNNHKQTKIILKANSFDTLFTYSELCNDISLRPYWVKNLTDDKWKDRYTCMGVGPYSDEEFEDIFKDLKLV